MKPSNAAKPAIAEALSHPPVNTLALFFFLLIACACCGLRCWLVLCILGAATHLGWFTHHPEWADRFSLLGNPIAMAVFLIIFLLEFGIDKTPRLDSWSDRLHLIFRPPAGAFVAFLGFSPMGLSAAIPAALAGGAIAWFVHSRKAKLRRKLNQSKPLFATIGISLLDDITVALLFWFAFTLLA